MGKEYVLGLRTCNADMTSSSSRLVNGKKTTDKPFVWPVSGEVVYCGDRRGATNYIYQNGGAGRIIVGGTATAGEGGTATAGDMGTLIIKRWDGERFRFSIAYVGENEILPNTPYKLDHNGNFVAV